MKSNGHVLVLGRDIRAFLAVIRSLGRMSLTVHVGMCEPHDLAARSRYVSHLHYIPEYAPESSAWFDTVEALAKTYRFELIIPCHDESVIPLQIYQNQLSPLAGLYVLDEDTYQLSFNKIDMCLAAESLNLKMPRQRVVKAEELAAGLPPEFSFPVVLKPPSSYSAEDLSTRREVLTAHGPAQFRDVAARVESWGMALIQECFPGIGTGVEVLAKEGEILVAFQHLRVHEPRQGGASSYRRQVSPIHQELLAATKTLIAHLRYTGVAMVEFKIDPETGEWIFIEINGRFWGSLPLATSAGYDFPKYLFELCTGGEPVPPAADSSPVYSRNLKRDLYWMIDNVRDRLARPKRYPSVPVGRMLLDFVRILRGREHIDSFAIDDPMPGIYEGVEILGIVAQKSLSVLAGVTRRLALRPLNKKMAMRKVSKARSVLFVCSGNICRSPFAEAVARANGATGVTYRSCGFHPEELRQSPSQAIETAREFDIDLSGHRSACITEAMVHDADVVFVFEQKHADRFKERFRHHAKKMFYLGDMLESGKTEIDDPYGGNDEAFRTAFERTARAVEAIL